MTTGFVATVTSKLDPVGVNGTNNPKPQGMVAVGAATVYAQGLPVAVVGSKTIWHGNPNNPKAPGFNPVCAKSFVVEGIANILVEGKPLAIAGPMGSLTTCGHYVLISPCKTVTATGPLG